MKTPLLAPDPDELRTLDRVCALLEVGFPHTAPDVVGLLVVRQLNERASRA